MLIRNWRAKLRYLVVTNYRLVFTRYKLVFTRLRVKFQILDFTISLLFHISDFTRRRTFRLTFAYLLAKRLGGVYKNDTIKSIDKSSIR